MRGERQLEDVRRDVVEEEGVDHRRRDQSQVDADRVGLLRHHQEVVAVLPEKVGGLRDQDSGRWPGTSSPARRSPAGFGSAASLSWVAYNDDKGFP